MNRIIVFLLMICSSSLAQELKITKATKQTLNAGASPISTTNYTVQFRKETTFKWSVDSVVNMNTQKAVSYNIVKIDDPNLASPNFYFVKRFSKKDKGVYQIFFTSSKYRGSGRPNSPTGTMVELPDFPKGAMIYYRAGKKKKQLLIEIFEVLETIDAP